MADEAKLKDRVKKIFRSKKSGAGPGTANAGARGPDAHRPLSSSFKGPAGSGPVDSATATAGGHKDVSDVNGNAQAAGHDTTTALPEAGVPGVDQISEKELKADFTHQPWQVAREKTRLAELEAEKAHIKSAQAQQHLKAAGAAQALVQEAQDKHSKVLADAEAARAAISSPKQLEAHVASAQEEVGAKRLAAEEAARKVKEAEALVADKAKLAEEHKPVVDEHHRKITTLTEEYDKHVKEVQGRESNKEELLANAQTARKTLDDVDTDVDGLISELSKADQIAAEREREFITAKDAAAAIAARLADAREKRGEAEKTYLAQQKDADEADEGIAGYREESERLKRQLDEYQEDWVKVQNVEKDHQKEADDAVAKLNDLRAEYEPHAKELKAAQEDLLAKQTELDAAHERSKKAEAKYRELSQLADQHAAKGAQAANAAHAHAKKYQDLQAEAHLHGSRHKELWDEAVGYGTQGSNIATDAVKKLQEKVQQILGESNSVPDPSPAA